MKKVWKKRRKEKKQRRKGVAQESKSKGNSWRNGREDNGQETEKEAEKRFINGEVCSCGGEKDRSSGASRNNYAVWKQEEEAGRTEFYQVTKNKSGKGEMSNQREKAVD